MRLDEFAVVQGDDNLGVDQLSSGAEAIILQPQPDDRSVSGSSSSPRTPLGPAQLSGFDRDPVQAQLDDNTDPTGPIPDAGSTPADSRPQAVVRLRGADRCDPQLSGRDLERCLKILELRADEFSLPSPPRLSAEQALLAGQSDDALAPARGDRNPLRSATVKEPDARLDSNQELASIFLAIPAPTSGQETDEITDDAATLADIIVAVQQGSLPPPPK
ncbi:MAG: hypothetical protein AB3N06_11540 [Erythrobacter sp.]